MGETSRSRSRPKDLVRERHKIQFSFGGGDDAIKEIFGLLERGREGRGGEMEMVFVVAAVEVIIIVIKVDKFSIYMTRPTTDRQPRDVF